MLEALNVSTEQSVRAVQVAQANIEWLKSDAAIVIINRLINQRVETETEPSTATIPTTTDTTDPKTQAACNVMLSTILGLLCAIMRLML